MLALAAAAGSAFMVAPTTTVPRNAMKVSMAVAEPVADEVDFKGAESWSADIAHPEPVFDILKIKEVLPHRYPFLLVDKVIEFVPGKKAVGLKTVTSNEEL